MPKPEKITHREARVALGESPMQQWRAGILLDYIAQQEEIDRKIEELKQTLGPNLRALLDKTFPV